jgi:hypothetical protein
VPCVCKKLGAQPLDVVLSGVSMSDSSITVRTKKFITNRLLQRRQFVRTAAHTERCARGIEGSLACCNAFAWHDAGGWSASRASALVRALTARLRRALRR